jgi:hypothetical protein
MNDEKVINVIEKYLKKSIYSYAVLIDGEWGSGKTYFVKNTLLPHINKFSSTIINGKSTKFEPLYISLYSISSIEEISSQIYIQILSKTENRTIKKVFQNRTIKKMSQNKTVKKISNLGVKVISDLIKSKDISVSEIIKVMMGDIDFEKYVLIFDDLERCGLNVNEVLGYINNYVEHDGIKTIIIANQNEMGKINTFNNLELKYLVASKKNINVDLNVEKQINKEGNLNVEELKERINIIFSENYLYEQIKEKLIGITIKYKADIGNIIENMMSEIIQDKELCQVAIKNKDFLLTKVSNLQHENLRTIQFALERFSELGDIICEQECREYKEQILEEVFRYTVYSSIRFKKENYINKWQGVSEMDFFSDDKERKFSTIKGFRFVDIVISQSVLDKEYIADFIKSYIKLCDEKYNPTEKLQAYWEMEDKDIIENLQEIEEKLKTNSINVNFYSRLIVKLIEIVHMGFNIEFLNNSIKYMELNITEESKWLRLEEFGGLPTKEKVLAEYNEKIKPLIKILERKRIENIENDLNMYFEDGNKEDWGSEFNTYCFTNRNTFNNNHAFFSLMKIYKVIDCLKLSNSKNISFFRYAINDVGYDSDYLNILKLRNDLSKELVNFSSVSKKYNIKLIIDCLNSKIEILKPKEDNMEEK